MSYKEYTIDGLILELTKYKKELGGNTKVYLSDDEFNCKQTIFEVAQVDGEDELYLFYDMNESLWEY